MGCLADAMRSFPQTGDYGDRTNQSRYQHPILNVDAEDDETSTRVCKALPQIGLPSLPQRKAPAAGKDAVKTASAITRVVSSAR
jgi:hypothetical protein